ncbi:MBL fold metallo-hydrolase [Neolewinella antarctica]|uniref:L-ascorbate metabolism protein UlaG (Beta-lactamase superfamily) n=1 Tax=Neolewinella antarctica TaxID=442734 RepID=A0ABX0XC96_9BACT|nr:MBL fold metallo-hydrolase [Neolewinella antarctica]NJC26402.1 L-ascorbate metabolism protein UlaG (beta-lactamase superfamily) [Neolewinella antarctica]
MTFPARNPTKVHFLLFLCLAIFTACGSPTDSENIGQDQAPETVDGITATPGNPNAGNAQASPVDIEPIVHGSVAMRYAGLDILIDPYDGAERYASYSAPDLVLITHTHSDHMDKATLAGLDLSKATLVAPQAVMNEIGNLNWADKQTMANGDTLDYKGNSIMAVPAYNFPAAPFHTKGEFNGYVIELGGERIYFSGDTGPAPELEELRNIDVAFVCMNQPYTMTVDKAADLVSKFRPGLVRPYHYRNKDGSFSDLEEFRKLVKEKAPAVKVLIEDWYAEK